MESQARAKRAASLVGSVASVDSKGKPRNFPIWPEFLESDINAEKWEGVTKGKEKGKSPSLQFFEDPEGRLDLPTSLAVENWKRPQDFMLGKIPVVVENESEFNLLQYNEHICHSQLMRSIITQVTALWEMNNNNVPDSHHSSVDGDPGWSPWEHIYSLCKATKGHIPLYNQYGKYVVRLFWMGHWRKIVVDDQMPFDANDQLLLPITTSNHELWPLLLTKALVKIAAIDYVCNNDASEIGDFYVIHALTGWIPEVIPIKQSPSENIWEFLKQSLPQWTLPETNPAEDENKTSSASSKRENVPAPTNSASHKEKGSGKDSKSREGKKRDDKEKSKSGSHSGRPISANSAAKSAMEDDPSVAKTPEMVVFASFNSSCDSPTSLTELRQMADISQKLRKVGLSYLHSHSVYVKQSRSCPLVATPPEVPIPKWKLIRPKKTFVTPHDQPKPKEKAPDPEMWLNISTALLGHTIRPLPVDTTTSRPHSRVSSPLTEINERGKNIRFSQNSMHNGESESASPREDGTENKSNVNSPENVEGNAEDQMSEGNESTDQPAKPVAEQSTWIHFYDFCQCFKDLTIFHKTSTYTYNHTVTELKPAALNAGAGANTGGSSSKKGSAQLTQASSNTNVLKSGLPSAITPKSYEGYPIEDRVPSFLFVDSLKQIQLIINYSVLPRWAGLEEKRMSDRESIADASDAPSVKQDNQSCNSGLLVAEPYSWKTLIKGQPVIRIRTTGTKAACVSLPPGRHVLQLTFNSPLGFHLTVCSNTKFTYGDEETVMVPLQNESCRFVAVADNIMTALGKCIESFGNTENWLKARQELHNAHMPYTAKNTKQLKEHYKAWKSALYQTFSSVSENKIPDLDFVFRCFTLDCEFDSLQGDAKASPEVPEVWKSKSASPLEEDAVTTLQKHWKSLYVRRIRRGHKDDTSEEHTSVKEGLTIIWTGMLADIQAQGLSLLRSMMDENSEIMKNYSFNDDEWNRICLADYQGTYPDQPAKTWFVVFREVFYVESDVLCVPKLFIPAVPTCVLRIVDNDTGSEIKRVFQKVEPHVYRKNKRGYTFMVEARTLDLPLTTGKWRMKLIGSRKPLPSPFSGQINSQFNVKEIRDYYIPNKLNILLRYHMEVSANHIGSVQLETSKPDVYIKLQVLDNEEEVISVSGKGHCVIPAFYFITNNVVEVIQEPLLNKLPQASKQNVQVSDKKRGGSAKSKDGKHSPKDVRKEVELKPQVMKPEIFEDPTIKHHYTIQALVEHNSWPLSETQLGFVQKLRDQEKEELKAFSVPKDRPTSGNKGTDRQSGGGSKPAAEKSKKGGKGSDKGGKDKKIPDKDSRPPSQNTYDGTQAFWALRFVSNQEQAEEVTLKRDNQRQEEIRAMKLAWEAAEPGRAVKAMQSRLSYLSKLKPQEPPAPEENAEVNEDGEPIEVPPPLPPPKNPIVDISSFYRPKDSTSSRKYFDKLKLEEKQNLKLSEQIRRHQEARKRSLAFRDENRNFRLRSKEQQIEACHEMQEQLDKSRARLLQPREDYRQHLLDEKRAKEEELNEIAAASLPPSPDGKRKSAGKKK
nr:androglobin [Ciona intestinalis]|eukprot:XP_002124575.1 androglobin [Ciona intestinalis]